MVGAVGVALAPGSRPGFLLLPRLDAGPPTSLVPRWGVTGGEHEGRSRCSPGSLMRVEWRERRGRRTPTGRHRALRLTPAWRSPTRAAHLLSRSGFMTWWGDSRRKLLLSCRPSWCRREALGRCSSGEPRSGATLSVRRRWSASTRSHPAGRAGTFALSTTAQGGHRRGRPCSRSCSSGVLALCGCLRVGAGGGRRGRDPALGWWTLGAVTARPAGWLPRGSVVGASFTGGRVVLVLPDQRVDLPETRVRNVIPAGPDLVLHPGHPSQPRGLIPGAAPAGCRRGDRPSPRGRRTTTDARRAAEPGGRRQLRREPTNDG